MVCRTLPAHTGVRSIPDFLWSGVKLPVWLPALLSTITCAADVRMAHARPFSTSTLQGLSNGIKNTSRKGFWPLQSSSEVVRVPEDSKFPLLGVWVSSSHLPQSGVATRSMAHGLGEVGYVETPQVCTFCSTLVHEKWTSMHPSPLPFDFFVHRCFYAIF
jgi:hypothetical protein